MSRISDGASPEPSAYPRPRDPPRLLRSLIQDVAGTLYAVVSRCAVSGLENIPTNGPGLVVFNHLSNFDPHLIFSLLPRQDAVGLVAANYRSGPLRRLAIEGAGGLWLRRGIGDRSALEEALRRLKNGWIVGIAPEGGRSSTGRLGAGNPGPAFLALRADVPVLPVALTGTERLHKCIPRLQRTRVTVQFGPAFRVVWPPGANRKDAYRSATEEIMCRLAALLPPSYRGEYRDHRRAVELTSARDPKRRPPEA